MKTYLSLIILSTLLSSAAFSQSEKQKIADIDKAKQEIDNSIPYLHKIENKKDSTGYSYTYENGKELELTAVYYKDKNIDKHVEWYFLNGQMIYVEQNWADNVTGKLIDEQKYYLSDKHLINWVKNGNQPIDYESKEFQHMDTALVAYGNRLENKYAGNYKGNTK